VLFHGAAAGDTDEIADCRVLLAGVPDHPVTEPLKRKFDRFLVAERLIERLLREVVVQHFGEQDQGINLPRRRLDNRAFFLCHHLGFPDTDITGRRHMNAGGIAPRSRNGRFERGILLLAVLQRVIDHEHDLGPFRGEALAPAGLPGLDQHRVTLRRAWHAEWAARPEVLPRMIEPMHLGRIGKAVIRLVQDQRVVFPSVPVPEHHLHELVCPVVAGVVSHVLGAAELAASTLFSDVTMLQAARPFSIRSIVAKRRATWNGS
jgi:hypothetical protein